MKKIRFLCFMFTIIFFYTFSNFAVSEETSTNIATSSATASQISKVTVYLGKALVTRTASINLQAGSNTAIFSDLPGSLNEDSVRASGQGVAAEITNVKVQTELHKEPSEERVKELTQQIETLKDQIKGLKDQENIIIERKGFLEGLKKFTIEKEALEKPFKTVNTQEWTALVQFFDTQAQESLKNSQDLQIKIREADKELAVLNEKLAQIQGSSEQGQTKSIEVILKAAKAGKLNLELSYLVPIKSFEPQYDLRLDPGGEKVQLRFGGQLAQTTGEDWQQVKLTFSTATPEIGVTPPQITPIFIKPRPIYKPQMEKTYGYAGKGVPEEDRTPVTAPGAVSVGEEFALEAAPSAPVEEKLAYSETKIETEGYVARFQVPDKVDIPADGAEHFIHLAFIDLKAEIEYYAVPKFSEQVYTRAKLIHEQEYPLLPGIVRIFSGTDFIGKNYLEKVAPGEEFEFYIGIEPGIKVKRELVKSEVSEKILSSKENIKRYRYLIKVENLSNSKETIFIQDQIPVSQTEKVKVKLTYIKPQPEKQDLEKMGLLKWKLEMMPKAKQELEFEYTIEADPTFDYLENY